jgi:hypothetical protein
MNRANAAHNPVHQCYDAQKLFPSSNLEEVLAVAASETPWNPQTEPASPPLANPQSPEELQDEARKIRRLQIVVNMVMQVIAQDQSVSVDEASEMVADTRRLALGMFPDKELAFNLIYWPRLQRLMRERYRMQ